MCLTLVRSKVVRGMHALVRKVHRVAEMRIRCSVNKRCRTAPKGCGAGRHVGQKECATYACRSCQCNTAQDHAGNHAWSATVAGDVALARSVDLERDYLA